MQMFTYLLTYYHFSTPLNAESVLYRIHIPDASL